MAKLTIISLENKSQFSSGATEYAMFQMLTETNSLVVVGLSHNFLRRKSIDEMDFDNLTDSIVDTKQSVNSLTGEINNPDETLEKVLDGEYAIMYLGTNNIAKLEVSEKYKSEKRELAGIVGAKMRLEKERETKQAKIDRARENRLAKIKKLEELALTSKKEENLFEEETPETPTEVPTEEVKEEESAF